MTIWEFTSSSFKRCTTSPVAVSNPVMPLSGGGPPAALPGALHDALDDLAVLEFRQRFEFAPCAVIEARDRHEAVGHLGPHLFCPLPVAPDYGPPRVAPLFKLQVQGRLRLWTGGPVHAASFFVGRVHEPEDESFHLELGIAAAPLLQLDLDRHELARGSFVVAAYGPPRRVLVRRDDEQLGRYWRSRCKGEMKHERALE